MKIVLPWKDDGMLIGDSGMWIGGGDRKELDLGLGTKPDVSTAQSPNGLMASPRVRVPGSCFLCSPCIPGMLKPHLGENLQETMEKWGITPEESASLTRWGG